MPLRVPPPTQAEVDELLLEISHDTEIFPEDTDEFITFTAGALDNEWSDWVEIEDGSGNKFSDRAVAGNMHLSAIIIESANVKDEVYMIEIAYGDAKTPVTPFRFIAGETTKLPPVQESRVRAEYVPAGEKIYYRMKCGDGGKICTLHIRYHPH